VFDSHCKQLLEVTYMLLCRMPFADVFLAHVDGEGGRARGDVGAL